MSIIKSLEKQRQIVLNAENLLNSANQANEANICSQTFSQESGITYEFNKPFSDFKRYENICIFRQRVLFVEFVKNRM